MEAPIQIRPKNYISRSAVLTFKACDYKGFLTYLFEGHGLAPEKQSLDLLIGIVFHRGRQHLLEHCRVHHPDGKFDDQCVDEAVSVAYELWNKQLEKQSLWLHSGEEARLPEILAEQECLFEGLIRAWAIRRLPQILEEYDILEVEQEEVYENFSPTVTWLGKADGLYRRKSDGALVLDSAKTASTYPEVTERNILHDMQGLSEWVAAEDRLKRWWEDARKFFSLDAPMADDNSDYPEWLQEKIAKDPDSAEEFFSWLNSLTEPPKIYAVQYDFALKGQRRKESYDDPASERIQNSFLCHPWKKDSLVSFQFNSTGDPTFGTTGDSYMWIRKTKGRLPKGWQRINIWEDVGIKAWIQMLATGKVQPEEGDPFLITKDEFGNIQAGVLYTPPLVIRTEFELAEWKISTKFFAERIFEYKSVLDAILDGRELQNPENFMRDFEEAIWSFFPKNTLSCHDFYGKDCQFVVHCHEMMSLQELEQSGYFVTREPHHEEERKEFVEKGYISDGE